MKENLKCKLIGHSGNSFEGGYHVCERCGLHSYFHSYGPGDGEGLPDYDKQAYLFMPFYLVLYRWRRLKNWASDKVYQWRKPGMPF